MKFQTFKRTSRTQRLLGVLILFNIKLLLMPATANAQDSWATMSSGAGNKEKSGNGESGAASVSNNFSGSGTESSSGGGSSGGGGSGGNEFGVENENIFGDDPLNSATPSNSPEEVGSTGGGENAGLPSENAGNNGGAASSPAQENSGNFNFNNNTNLNKQSANGNANAGNQGIVSDAATNAGTNAPASDGTLSNTPLINSTPVSDATSALPTGAVSDQPAPVESPQPDPGYAAATIPLANDFAGAPPIPGTRRIMADGEAPIEYSVESGDTLYDVCDQLLDEGGYWPKLWSLNPEIKNPHFIYPGMKLRFYPGDNETVPFLEVVSEDDVVPLDKGPLNEKELIAEDVPIRADREQSAEAPPELIRAEDLQVPQEILDMFMMVGGRYAGSAVQLTIPGFIFAEEKTPEGYVIGGREGRVAVTAGNYVVVEQSGSLSPGTSYTVLRPAGKVEKKDGETVGYRYVFVANMKIKQIEDDVAVGVVTDTRLGVQTDDILVAYLSTSRNIDSLAKGSATPAPGEVVGFDERGQNLGREGGFVFVSKSGVSEGQFVPVYRGSAAYDRGAEDGAPRDLDPIGQIRIIDASGGAALGIITEALNGIKIGDTLSR